jgi:hypothetical protein
MILSFHELCVSVCVFTALVTQHAKRIRPTIMTSMACPALPHISALCHKRHDLRKSFPEHKMCISIFSTFLRNISHFKKNSARYHENPSTASQVVPGGQTDTHGQANSPFPFFLQTRLYNGKLFKSDAGKGS